MDASPASNRHESLDVLRGVAILGIFAVNIIGFGYTFQVFGNPSATPAFYEQGGAFWWMVSTGLFTQKFITIFSALFGAGIIMMLGEEKASPKIPIHRRRMFWLVVFGMLHAHLLWYGDILFPYAIIGFLVARSRIWRSRSLIIIGTILVILNFGLVALQGMAPTFMPPEEFIEMKNQTWAPPPEVLQAEMDKYRFGFFERIPFTVGNSLMFQVVQTLGFGLRTAGMMMFGMVLYRSGFLTLQWRPRLYGVLGLIFTVIGVLGSFWSAHHHIETEFSMLELFSGQAVLYWASLIQAFGYASLVMAICTIGGLKILRMPFAAAGRMALSNYLASTIIGVMVFFGPPGLGRIGSMDFPGLARVVGGVWLFILIWSPIWLAVFRFGPAEWLWRTLTYGRLQPVFNFTK